MPSTDIHRVLVANRGEIATRIMRTLKEVGIEGIAVYHSLDRDSPFVAMADEAVELTGPSPVGCYLDIEQVVAACKKVGADAVHPGYGFLSENPLFARALEAAGITFIGPPPQAISLMGDKVSSKRVASGAGVNTVPGLIDSVPDAQSAVTAAGDIGYPVILKATAGGGGKGMRVAQDDEECRAFFAHTSEEAKAGFGDGRVFVEKFIQPARHIEVQILADHHGNVIHLGERECSIQRRHQKVIEEAPAPTMNEKMRATMGAQAVSLAQAVDYRSAGTVEFIVDGDQNFFFLEMNTRLQVEHPVTELVTGIDIVREQLRIASGDTLRYEQEDIRLTGHSVECRIYAEDADDGFAPSTGTLLVYREPQGEGVRIDSAVTEGSEVSSAFDPLLAKLVTYGDDREEAIARASMAIQQFVVLGVTTNASYLERALRHDAFSKGELHTGFLEEHALDLSKPPPTDRELATVLAAAALSNTTFFDARFATPRHLAILGDWSN